MDTLHTPDFGIYVPLGPMSARNAGEMAEYAVDTATGLFAKLGIVPPAMTSYTEFGVTLMSSDEVARYAASHGDHIFSTQILAKYAQEVSVPQTHATNLARITGAAVTGSTWGIQLDPESLGVHYAHALGEELNNLWMKDTGLPLPLSAQTTIPLFEVGAEEAELTPYQELALSAITKQSIEKWDRGKRALRFGRLVIGPSMTEPFGDSSA